MVKKTKKVDIVNCTCKVKISAGIGRDCVCRMISGKFGKRRMRDIQTKGISLAFLK